MLSVNINRDVEQYQESVLLGLNARQTVSALVTLLGGVGIIAACHYLAGISLQTGVYLAMPVCILLFLPALKTKEGIPVTELVKRSGQRRRKLLYKSMDVKKQGCIGQLQKGKKWQCRVNQLRKGTQDQSGVNQLQKGKQNQGVRHWLQKTGEGKQHSERNPSKKKIQS